MQIDLGSSLPRFHNSSSGTFPLSSNDQSHPSCLSLRSSDRQPLNSSHLRESLCLQVDFLPSLLSLRPRIQHLSLQPPCLKIDHPAFWITSSQIALSPSFYMLHFQTSWLPLSSPYSTPRKFHSFP